MGGVRYALLPLTINWAPAPAPRPGTLTTQDAGRKRSGVGEQTGQKVYKTPCQRPAGAWRGGSSPGPRLCKRRREQGAASVPTGVGTRGAWETWHRTYRGTLRTGGSRSRHRPRRKPKHPVQKEQERRRELLRGRNDLGAGRESQEPSSLSAAEQQRPCGTPLRLLLVGKRGAGKSASGNTILGRAVFESRFSDRMVTKVWQRESGTAAGRPVVVIDTPAPFPPPAGAGDPQGPELSAAGGHVLLLAIAIGHYTAEDEAAFQRIQEACVAGAVGHTVVLFTRKDELGDEPLQDYIDSKASLRDLVQRVGGRCCAFNNKARGAERDSQVAALLRQVEDLVLKNAGLGCETFRLAGSEFQGCVNKAASQGALPCGPGDRPLQAPGPERAAGAPDLQVLLVGKQGAGKSRTGNSILGRQAFETRFSRQSVTRQCESESMIWRKKKVLVIDAPELSSLKSAASQLRANMVAGPDAFLLVIPLGPFDLRDMEVLFQAIQTQFGEKYIDYTIILFTRREDLPGEDPEAFLSRNEPLWRFVQQCGDRYRIFDNWAPPEARGSQAEQLLLQVEAMAQRHGGRPCVFREKEPLSLVLVGRSGTGKSATGNTILGEAAFPSQLRAQPVTQTCQQGRRTLDWQEVVVVDTPLFPPVLSAEKGASWLEAEVGRCWALCEGGAKIIVLVFELGRFTKADEAAVAQLEATFGSHVLKYTILLFTRKEDLGSETFRDYIHKTTHKGLRKIVRRCGGRVCAFNNRDSDPSRDLQVKELLTIANDLRKTHERGYPDPWEKVRECIKNAQGGWECGLVARMLASYT